MKKQIFECLLGSIRKWINIILEDGVDAGQDNCPLCGLFFENDCRGCPIFIKTKKIHCNSTPYQSWINHQENKHKKKLEYKIYCPTCLALAKKELNSLISLLPK